MNKQPVPSPPRWATRLLRCLCAPHRIEEMEGDLDELFRQRVQNAGLSQARWRYVRDVVSLMRPSLIKRKATVQCFDEYPTPNQIDMLRNYLKIAWRNLVKQKLYSSIKIGGLAVGMAACLLIALYVRQEVSYDGHYANRDRIYRIVEFSTHRGETGSGVHFPAPLASTLQAEYPEFEKVGHYNAVELFGAGSQEVRRSDKPESTHEDGFVYVSQELLDILEIPFIAGDPMQALTEPNTIVITKSKAAKYFPNQNPIGKLIILNNDEQRQYRISGVINDFSGYVALPVRLFDDPFGQRIRAGRTNQLAKQQLHQLRSGSPRHRYWAA